MRCRACFGSLQSGHRKTQQRIKRITKPVEQWFTSEVPKHGWAGSNFLPEVQSGHGAGCVLFVPPSQVNVNVQVTNKTLILVADED